MGEVISLFDKRQEKAKDEAEQAPVDPLAEAEARNKELKARKERERLDANKGVLRSYRIRVPD